MWNYNGCMAMLIHGIIMMFSWIGFIPFFTFDFIIKLFSRLSSFDLKEPIPIPTTAAVKTTHRLLVGPVFWSSEKIKSKQLNQYSILTDIDEAVRYTQFNPEHAACSLNTFPKQKMFTFMDLYNLPGLSSSDFRPVNKFNFQILLFTEAYLSLFKSLVCEVGYHSKIVCNDWLNISKLWDHNNQMLLYQHSSSPVLYFHECMELNKLLIDRNTEIVRLV